MFGHGWRKSRYSGNSQNCVEVRPTSDGVLVRDTKDGGRGPEVPFSATGWTAFLAETGGDDSVPNGVVTLHPSGDGMDLHVVGTGAVLHFTGGEWTAFRNGVRDGEFDLLVAA